MTRSTVKTARESARAMPGRRKPKHGRGELLTGGVPGNAGGTGRPPNRIRALAAEIVEKDQLLKVLGTIAASAPKQADRINATKVLLAYADAHDSDLPPDPTGDGPSRYVAVYLPANGR